MPARRTRRRRVKPSGSSRPRRATPSTQFIQQKVDAIFDVAVADKAVPAALAAASAANIPVISIGAGTLASKPVAHPSFASVDLPYELMGQMEGYYMVAASNGIDQIRKGGPVIFCNTPAQDWFGWAAVDQMGRHFAGLPTSNFLLPLAFWDTENLTSSTPNSPATFSPFDFKSYYKKLWGVKQ